MKKTKKTAAQTGDLFKQTVPKMPEGYYSGDKPNPNLRAFVEQHLREKPYDPATDDYDVPAFNKSIDTTKSTAIYNMHTYWSKKPHDAIRQYIRHYTSPGDLVLDPFCGSGGTALAALAEGRKAIAIDRSPAATFISKNYCTPVDVIQLNAAFKKLKGLVKEEIDWLYQTRAEGNDKKAITYSTVYSALFQCSRCLTVFPLFHAKSEKEGYNTVTHYCPHCAKGGSSEKISLRSRRVESVPVMLTFVDEDGTYHDRSFPYPRNDADFPDLLHIKDIDQRPIHGRVPEIDMMNVHSGRWGLLQRPYHGEIRQVSDFYSPRNLRAIAVIIETIRTQFSGDLRDCLLFAIEAISMNMSKLQGYSTNPRFPNNMMKGVLYTPPIWREYNVLNWLEGKLRNLSAGFSAINEEVTGDRPVMFSTQSACDLGNIPSDSIDFIFTDPPYSDKIQFGELNFIWEAWLGFNSDWKGDEIIVNEIQGKDEDTWRKRMQGAVGEIYRTLKPGRWLSLCYHDSSEGSWSVVQDLMSEAGFLTEVDGGAVYIDTNRKSWKQLVADKVTKRDLVINFRKPKPGERQSKVVITGAEDEQSFRQKAQAVIREFLQTSPGSTKDRIYDSVVSRLVRKGQMEAHNFDELLREVAEEVKEPVKKNLFENEEPDLLGSHQVGRWHLKETEAGGEEAERATADSAGTRIHEFLGKTTASKLKESERRMGEWRTAIDERRTKLRSVDQGKSEESCGKLVREIRELTVELDKLTAERAEWERQALDYSQIFEFYIAAVNPKPKATLEELLEDYCYQTDEGNWRPPLTEPEKKEKGSERQRAVRRKIQRFCNILEAGEAIAEGQRPDAPTLAEWIRHCRRTGLHAQGKLLYERGGDLSALSEQAQVDVEEDYQVCVKGLAKGGAR